MLRTEKFALTIQDYFKMLIVIYLKRRWWMISLTIFMGFLFLLKNEKESLDYFFIFFGFFYPIIILIQYWRFASSRENSLFLIERYYEISEDELIGKLSDGSESTIKKANFIKSIELKSYYLLYISKSQFVYIPKKAFINQDDEDFFITEYFNKTN